MAKFREPEYCPHCGKQLKAIHADRGNNFSGDTFIGYKECDCKNYKPEYADDIYDAVREYRDNHPEPPSHPTPSSPSSSGKEEISRQAWQSWEDDQKTNPNGVNPHAYVYGYKAGYAAMDSYAASLIKEKEELRLENETFKDAMVERNERCNQLTQSNEAKDKEIERLKILIEQQVRDQLKMDAVICNWTQNELISRQNEDWEKFKSENNI